MIPNALLANVTQNMDMILNTNRMTFKKIATIVSGNAKDTRDNRGWIDTMWNTLYNGTSGFGMHRKWIDEMWAKIYTGSSSLVSQIQALNVSNVSLNDRIHTNELYRYDLQKLDPASRLHALDLDSTAQSARIKTNEDFRYMLQELNVPKKLNDLNTYLTADEARIKANEDFRYMLEKIDVPKKLNDINTYLVADEARIKTNEEFRYKLEQLKIVEKFPGILTDISGIKAKNTAQDVALSANSLGIANNATDIKNLNLLVEGATIAISDLKDVDKGFNERITALEGLTGGMTQAEHHENLAYFFLQDGYFSSYLKNLFESFFGGLGEDNLFSQPTGKFSKWLYQGFKILVENLLDVKTAINDNFKTAFVKLDWLEIINENIKTSLIWLKTIAEKPTGEAPIINFPPFDFDRLQEMLDGLNFGNVVNEAGTNIWDFLNELVNSLGSVLTTGLSEISDLIQKLLDFLNDFLDKIIYLFIPKNWDFLENGFGALNNQITVKFGSFLNLGSKVKEAFKPIEGDFFSSLSFDLLGTHFDFSGGKQYLDNFVPKFRLLMSISLWLSTAIWVYKKITGGGDVIAD